MTSIWQSLAWKEWQEHKWLLAAFVAVVFGTSALALVFGGIDRLSLAMGMQVVCIAPLAVFLGATTAANERSRKTMPFLQALPVPMWRVATMKLIAGLGTLLVTIALMAVPLYMGQLVLNQLATDAPMVPKGTFGNIWYFDSSGFALLIAPSLFLWTAAAGARRKDEVSAGATALAVFVAYWFLVVGTTGYLTQKFSDGSATPVAELLALSTAPGGLSIFTGAPWQPHLLHAIAPAVISLVILAAIYVRHFSTTPAKIAASQRPARMKVGQTVWLAPPRRSPFTAIAWKQLRESGPLVLSGIAAALGCILVTSLANYERIVWHDVAQIALGILAYFCVIVSLVAGIGAFLSDLTPQISNFWRSRPINETTWYWTKYFGGWAIVMVTFGSPLLAIAWQLGKASNFTFWHADLIYLALMPLAIYSAAAAATCLVRHAVYAAVLSIPLAYLGVLLLGGALAVGRLIGVTTPPARSDFWYMTDLQIAIGMLLSTAICAVTGWLAVRNDWGWSGRR